MLKFLKENFVAHTVRLNMLLCDYYVHVLLCEPCKINKFLIINETVVIRINGFQALVTLPRSKEAPGDSQRLTQFTFADPTVTICAE
ncbi:polcalcin Phl p [Trifolium repens]|jgi:hypothetical protein|nr:polcalcin Phl p [Trifolium repens]